MKQENSYHEFSEKIHDHDGHVFFISGKTFDIINIPQRLSLTPNCTFTRFSDFTENPTLEELVKAKEAFLKSGASLIVAVGGGSAIDLAKLVKHYAYTPITGTETEPPLSIEGPAIELLVIPTTFGTGSEATHFAVLYINSTKYSIANQSILPDSCLIDGSLSTTLPIKTKGAASLDALAQAIESYWSVSATDESRQYAQEAIELIKSYLPAYLSGDIEASNHIANASYLAGKAINITKTTAAHALSYTLTAQYNIPHGHAVALCIKKMFDLNMQKAAKNDMKELVRTMENIYSYLGVKNGKEADALFHEYMVISELFPNLTACITLTDIELNKIVNSVNLERLKNHPVSFSLDEIKTLF